MDEQDNFTFSNKFIFQNKQDKKSASDIVYLVLMIVFLAAAIYEMGVGDTATATIELLVTAFLAAKVFATSVSEEVRTEVTFSGSTMHVTYRDINRHDGNDVHTEKFDITPESLVAVRYDETEEMLELVRKEGDETITEPWNLKDSVFKTSVLKHVEKYRRVCCAENEQFSPLPVELDGDVGSAATPALEELMAEERAEKDAAQDIDAQTFDDADRDAVDEQEEVEVAVSDEVIASEEKPANDEE